MRVRATAADGRNFRGRGDPPRSRRKLRGEPLLRRRIAYGIGTLGFRGARHAPLRPLESLLSFKAFGIALREQARRPSVCERRYT
jgi:hypothetical protein